MEKLKELRLFKNFTQSELAEMLGCTQTAVGKYERGQLEPNLYTLKKLADIFSVSVDYLLGREDDFGNVVAKTNNGAELSPAEWDFVRKMRALDPRHIKVLEMQLETLTELQAESLKK